MSKKLDRSKRGRRQKGKRKLTKLSPENSLDRGLKISNIVAMGLLSNYPEGIRKVCFDKGGNWCESCAKFVGGDPNCSGTKQLQVEGEGKVYEIFPGCLREAEKVWFAVNAPKTLEPVVWKKKKRKPRKCNRPAKTKECSVMIHKTGSLRILGALSPEHIERVMDWFVNEIRTVQLEFQYLKLQKQGIPENQIELNIDKTVQVEALNMVNIVASGDIGMTIGIQKLHEYLICMGEETILDPEYHGAGVLWEIRKENIHLTATIHTNGKVILKGGNTKESYNKAIKLIYDTCVLFPDRDNESANAKFNRYYGAIQTILKSGRSIYGKDELFKMAQEYKCEHPNIEKPHRACVLCKRLMTQAREAAKKLTRTTKS